jgi:hypothetical protein
MSSKVLQTTWVFCLIWGKPSIRTHLPGFGLRTGPWLHAYIHWGPGDSPNLQTSGDGITGERNGIIPPHATGSEQPAIGILGYLSNVGQAGSIGLNEGQDGYTTGQRSSLTKGVLFLHH